MKKLFMLAAIVAIASWSAATAQQQEPSLKPSVSRAAAGPVKLLLEITYNPTLPPAYSTVNGTDETPKWIWVTRFARIGQQSPPRINAVKLESQFNGETADVRVTLLRGVKVEGFDREDLVGNYKVGLGEQKILGDLRSFGVEPFTIKLLDTVPPLPPPPTFESLTKAIEIVSVQSENIPKPAYRITFRNLSEKNVWALRVDVTSDGRRGVTTLMQGDEGRPLIEAGGMAERYIPVVKTERTATGYAPGTAASNSIAIRSAVFQDLSFEGDSESACLFESFVVGRRLWLTKVLPLLDQELLTSNDDSVEAAKQFKAKFSALTYDLDESERNRASSVSSTCPKPAERAHIAPEGLKLQMLRDLDEIITTRPAPPVNFNSWLKARHESYKAWLARL